MHIPVMLRETLDWLDIRPDGVYLDCTCGLGGHTGAIAQRLTTGMVIANDWDAESLEMAQRNTAEVADRVFPVLQTRGFGFDVEVLYRAQHAGYQVVEVPTRWINSPQSRVHPIRDSTAMFLELLAIPGRVRKHPTKDIGLKDANQASA